MRTDFTPDLVILVGSFGVLVYLSFDSSLSSLHKPLTAIGIHSYADRTPR